MEVGKEKKEICLSFRVLMPKKANFFLLYLMRWPSCTIAGEKESLASFINWMPRIFGKQKPDSGSFVIQNYLNLLSYRIGDHWCHLGQDEYFQIGLLPSYCAYLAGFSAGSRGLQHLKF